MTSTSDKIGPPPRDGVYFRAMLGFVVMLTAVGGFAALFFIRVPPENKDAMMFALGAVFGWAGSVVASEYGATTTGRKIAEAATRQMEQQTVTAADDADAARAAGD
jgi:hypothetical protein